MAKKRIAILGGGMGSLATAFELTSRPGWQDDFDITVFQTGWRLGGKGASGRNRKLFDRIEEHGLHIMFGFYDNVFRVMKEVYDELGRNPGEPLATWQDAFKPHDLIVMMEKVGDKWLPWEVSPPRNDLVPGVSNPIAGPFAYLVELLEHVVKRWHGWTKASAKHEVAAAAAELGSSSTLDELRAHARAAREAVASGAAGAGRGHDAPGLLAAVEHALWHGLKRFVGASTSAKDALGEFVYLDIAHGLARKTPKGGEAQHLDLGDHDLIKWLLRRFLDWLWRELEAVETDLRRLRLELDFAITIAIGMIEDGLVCPPTDWFKIDDHDFRDWLKRHGARQETIDCPLVQGLYDAIFSTDAPMGAGTIVHLLLLMGTEYKGSVLWKMQAGMGDTIFTPLYEVLRRRGVKFEFFHTVEELVLSADKKSIERIELGIQATVKPGLPPYRPLWPVKGLDCWPSAPLFEQLVEGAQLEREGIDLENFWSGWKPVGHRTLRAGDPGPDGFDICLCGISIGAMPFIAKQLIDAEPRWKAMVDSVTTCQTAALQLWFAPGLAQTGWKTRSTETPVVIPYVEPLDTWACMDQLIDKESWPPDLPVGSLAYLCSNLVDVEPVPPASDHGYAARQNQRVHDISLKWLKENTRGLWPRAAMKATPDELNWWWLVDPKKQDGVARFESQFWHAPVSPSERYVLSVPCSSGKRLRPGDSGFSNLVLAGDWTLTALSAGCLEATTMSSIMAAEAIDGCKRYIAYDWLPPSGPVTRPCTPPPPPGPPKFIARDGQLMATPPISMKTTLYMFLLDADMAAIQAMCDRYLNIGVTDLVYRPLVPWVMFYGSYAESAPVDDPIGWCPEKDFGFWVPVVAGRVEGAAFFPVKMQVFTPYLWVDSGVAMVGGREVYGFPKELGVMTMPAKPTDPARFTVDTLVIPKYGKESMTVEKRIIDLQRMDATIWSVLEELWGDGRAIVKALEELVHAHGPGRFPVPDGMLLLQMLRQLGRELPMIFLKQFPEVGTGGGAVYQALVEAPVQITSGIKGGFLPGQYKLDIWSFDSHQIVKNLGLRVAEEDGNRSQVRSLAHGWVQFDALVAGGKVVGRAKR